MSSGPNYGHYTYTPTSQRSPTTPTFSATTQVQTFPRQSTDTILSNPALHGVAGVALRDPSAPLATAGRFGFSGKAGRHSVDSPVGYSYGRLGTMFSGPTNPYPSNGPTLPPSGPSAIPGPATGGRIPVQAGYASGSREHIVEQPSSPPPTHTHSASMGGTRRASPVPSSSSSSSAHFSVNGGGGLPGLPGRASPGFAHGVVGVTGLVRPPGLDPHLELDERSLRTDQTESGYGFGGIVINEDGVMLSPVDDDLEEPPYTPVLGDPHHHHPEEGGEDDEEEETEEETVSRLLQPGVFEGDYESTEGHDAPRSAESGGVTRYYVPLERRPASEVPTFGKEQTLDDGGLDIQERGTPSFSPFARQMSPVEAQPSSYPYPITYPSQDEDESPDTSGELDNTTLTQPRLPPGLEHLIQQGELEEAVEQPSRDSTVERDLLSELARQLQRVVGSQSTTSLTHSHTPSSVLLLEHTESGDTGHSRTASEVTDKLDEFGRWRIEDLKGAVERMKALIDEQEKRMHGSHGSGNRNSYGHGHTKSKASISLNDTPPPSPPIRRTLLPSEEEESTRHFPLLGENGQTTPRRRLSNAALAVDAAAGRNGGGANKRKESEGSSSATATSTTVVTPITPHEGGPGFGLPPMLKSGIGRERAESVVDLTSLDPDLVAMLSPNHMTRGQAELVEQGEDRLWCSCRGLLKFLFLFLFCFSRGRQKLCDREGDLHYQP